ncbi:acyl-CoA dehydrogenase family protein [Sporomusa acidovorans]|uniref:Acyl-CoA dehydrogenase, short-chain specific n=1 Tax=Sporomusa acidovorans (strain ATCC 49682 / DSM 3132 / Mol) TaxID=1123286 RepID=A0ABZ3J5M5_SPOA4|nr:acyl-CoA dehydrogenase family protein [Sporomusa acidovorans]OZC24311.1 acyl-CoA dehydrogenase [Sporomusa acidovorans DSM 3132]SDF02313.1 butyryl-CoA dehydrogenase [Sporomusa acidovorans]
MGFELTEEQRLIQSMAREFAINEVAPLAERIDRDGEFPTVARNRLAELELTGIPTPAEYGGGGADYVSYALVIEEIAKVCASTAVVLAVHTLAQAPILKFGTPEQKAKFLPMLAGYKALGGFALTEAGAGSDAGALATTAVLEGDHYVINGTKTFITNGDGAGVMIVMAKTGPGEGTKGISAFIVEKNESPYTVGKHEDKMGVRGSHTTELIFKNCKVPKENLLGKIGQGFKVAMATLDGGRIGIAAQAVGIAQACLDESVRYSKERKQFGRPIAANQAIQWMIADMAKDVLAARLLVHNAAALCDSGQPFSLEAAAAKLFAAETAMKHSIKAVQINGGYGYIRGAKVERLMRDAKITEIYEGTSEVQRMVISGMTLR